VSPIAETLQLAGHGRDQTFISAGVNSGRLARPAPDRREFCLRTRSWHNQQRGPILRARRRRPRPRHVPVVLHPHHQPAPHAHNRQHGYRSSPWGPACVGTRQV